MRDLTTAFGDAWDHMTRDFFREVSNIRYGHYEFIEKDPNESVLHVSAPGYTTNDLAVEMHEGRLTITGSVPAERLIGALVPQRVKMDFQVSPSFRVEQATLENGILSVHLVRQTKSDPVKIPISAA
jgi:HSP20 family molecular chaperone IbpA